MSNSEHIFRYGGVDSKSFLLAIKHNRRELQKELGKKRYIDVSRTPLNYYLHGLENSQRIEREANALIALAGIRVRKNAVWAVEIIYSLPISWHEKDSKPFFEDCYEWTKKTFEGVLLSFDVHLDESAPHAHTLILPLIDEKMQGDKLKGDRKKIYERHNLFYEEVASLYGFNKPIRKQLNQTKKKGLAQKVLARLYGDSIQNSAIFSWVRDKIFEDPVQCAQILGISLKSFEEVPTKSFVDIKRSKGNGTFIR